MINVLINKILRTKGYWDETLMGDSYLNCPFCPAHKLDSENNYSIKMDDLEHEEGCLYLLAKELKK